MPTSEHVDSLRAMVHADFERHEELTGKIQSWEGYEDLIGAAFFIAVNRQFPDGHTPDQVIRLVAEMRSLLDRTGDGIEPRAAELMIRSALGDEDLAAQVPDATGLQLQIVAVSALAEFQRLGAPDEFLAQAVSLATKWEQD